MQKAFLGLRFASDQLLSARTSGAQEAVQRVGFVALLRDKGGRTIFRISEISYWVSSQIFIRNMLVIIALRVTRHLARKLVRADKELNRQPIHPGG
jgi:hypothetical protein